MRSHRIPEDRIHVTSDHMGQHLLVRPFLQAGRRPSCWESPLRPGFGPGKGLVSYIAIMCRRAFSCVIMNDFLLYCWNPRASCGILWQPGAVRTDAMLGGRFLIDTTLKQTFKLPTGSNRTSVMQLHGRPATGHCLRLGPRP